MDAASAAAMSDPDWNPQFRRRWNERPVDDVAPTSRHPNTALGTLGLALQEALSRAARSATTIHLHKPPEGRTDG